jgi:hypothetical protein
VFVREWFLFLYFKYWYFRSLKRFWDCDFNFANVLELHHSMHYVIKFFSDLQQQASTLTFVRLSGTSENWRRTSRSCITVVRRDKCATLILPMSLNFITAWRTINDTIKRILIWRFTLVLIKINYGQIGDQTGLFNTSKSCITVVRRDKWKNQRFTSVPVRWTNLFPLV